MKVVCVIVTYNGMKWIDRCLDSLAAQTVPVDTIVIDNASKDATVTHIREKFAATDLVQSDKNLGFGQANNIGLEKAIRQNADYVLLLNQDAWLEKDAVEKMINAAGKYPEYGIFSPFHLSYDGTQVEKYFNDWVIGNYTPDFINDIYLNKAKEIYSSNFIHAACWLMPLAVVKETGGFDPLFFHYGEDVDYVQRLRSKDLKVGFIPSAILYHYGTNDGLNNPGKNIAFKINEAAIRFKDPKASMAGATLVFLKTSFDALTSALLYRRMGQLKIEWKVFFTNLKRIGSIRRSRKNQLLEKAFLSKDNL